MSGVMDSVGRKMNDFLSLKNKSKKMGDLSEKICMQSERLDCVERDFRGLIMQVNSDDNNNDYKNNDEFENNINHNNLKRLEDSLTLLKEEVSNEKSSNRENRTVNSLAIEALGEANHKIKKKINDMTASVASISGI
jgi:hypothetical protein